MTPNHSPAMEIHSNAEILKEVDATEELKLLSDSWKEIVAHRHHYSLVEMRFAKEHQ